MNRTKFFLGALMGVTVLGAGILMFKGTEQNEPDTATGVAHESAPVLKAVGSRPGNAGKPGAGAYAVAHDAAAGSGDAPSSAATANDFSSAPTPSGEQPTATGPVSGPIGNPVSGPLVDESDAPPAEDDTPSLPLEEPIPGSGQQSPEVAPETPAQGKPANIAVSIGVEKCKVVKCVQQPKLELANVPFDVCDLLRCVHFEDDGQGSGGGYGPVRVADRDDEPSKPVIKAPLLTGILWRN
jgi:hypothetical protein